jgi:membrane protein DedA with SNARE-associated domain/rhodanese-related sulfurtransferase
MNLLLSFLIQHGYTLLFAWVLLEQAGLPVPSSPLLLAAGALSGTGHMHLAVVIALAVTATLMSDVLWYELGRLQGVRVLRFICRISLEPDSCVRRTQTRFGHQGANVLLFSKFIPGLNAMSSPLSGIIRMSRRRFFSYDAAGALFWVCSYTLAGYVFSGELERIAERARYLGEWVFVAAVLAFAGYIGWKYENRQRFLRNLRIARITPEELKEKMDAGEDVIVVDLRHELDFEAEPETIPGALHLDAADLEEAHEVIPRDREIVLFCACPNEATAARLALLLRDRGITRIRPLAEGYEGWRKRGFPMERPRDEPRETEPTGAYPQPR